MPPFRRTTQPIAPLSHEPPPPGDYDIYPAFPIAPGLIATDLAELARRVAAAGRITIDGYGGVLWAAFREGLDAALVRTGVLAHWIDVADAMHSPATIDELIAPFLGGDDPLWGTRCTLELADLFDAEALAAYSDGGPQRDGELTIIHGCGAALAGWSGPLIYLDVPKNEIQFRARAASITNLGAVRAGDAKEMYKRFYFVDWPLLNRHKAAILRRVDVMIDAQRPDAPVWIDGDAMRAALDAMTRGWVRPRPWFEPGPWGGQWIKERIPELPRDAPNYAWSFELIAPENGVMLRSGELLLEVSFDTLMYHDHVAMLGDAAGTFGTEFPIRFDFLDTFDGGNLSVQCHPRPEYIRRHFGERFTQDETYYILDCAPGAVVFLGFNEGIDPLEFRTELERSRASGSPVEIEHYVNTVMARRHDLFLIPHGTIHCSGRDNLVLEISATPYIFTFKMYDWVRRDLGGNLRPINIERAWENLFFERTSARVDAELIARPREIAAGDDWRIVHLRTHPDHFYDVERLEFDTSLETATAGAAHVLSLVEGSSVVLETSSGLRQRFNYAETFVIPAAAGSYRLRNEGGARAMVVRAFVKPGAVL